MNRRPLVLIYGRAKVGKTKLACSAPDCRILDGEGGAREAHPKEVIRIEGNRALPITWPEVLSTTKKLEGSWPGGKYLVIDGAGRIEQLCIDHVLETARNSKNKDSNGNPQPYQGLTDDFCKPAELVVEQWRKLLRTLENIRELHGVGVIIVAHEKNAKEKNVETGETPRVMPAFVSFNSASIAALMLGWVDICARLDVLRKTEGTWGGMPGKEGKDIRVSTGNRVLYTCDKGNAFDAGVRDGYYLDEEIGLTRENGTAIGWKELQAQLDAGPPPWPAIEKLKEEGEKLIVSMADEKKREERAAELAKMTSGRYEWRIIERWKKEGKEGNG